MGKKAKIIFFIVSGILISVTAFAFIQAMRHNSSLEKELLYLKDEFQSAQEVVNQIHAKEIVERETRQTEESRYKADYLRALEENTKLSAEKEKFQSQLSELTQSKKNLDEDRAALEAKRKEGEDLRAQVKAAEDKLKEVNARLEQVAAENKRLSQIIEEEKEGHKKAFQKAESLRSDLEKKSDESLKKDKEAEGLRRDVRKAEKKSGGILKTLDTTKKRLEAEKINLQKEIQKIKEKDAANRKAIAELKRIIKENGRQREQLIKALNKTKKENQELLTKQQHLISEDSKKLLATLEHANGRIRILEKETAVTHYNLGVLYMRQNQYKAAAEEFEFTVLRNPNDALAHYNLAVLYEAYLEKTMDALPHYEAYVRLLPQANDIKSIQQRILNMRLEDRAGVAQELRAMKREN